MLCSYCKKREAQETIIEKIFVLILQLFPSIYAYISFPNTVPEN